MRRFGRLIAMVLALAGARATATPAPAAPKEMAIPLSIDVGPQAVRPVVLVAIPPGEFLMGSDRYVPQLASATGAVRQWWHSDSSHPPDEGPMRRTRLSRGFHIGKTKVSAAQYCVFLNDCRANAHEFIDLNKFSTIELANGVYRPRASCELAAVNTASWIGATRFCEWLSERSGHHVRLPTEAEWEFAARGPTGRAFPWGDRVASGTRYNDPHNPCVAIGTFPENATPEGVLDMVGPTGEWCADFYSYDYEPAQRVDPTGPAKGEARILRARSLSATLRWRCAESATDLQGAGIYGFRVVTNGAIVPAAPDIAP